MIFTSIRREILKKYPEIRTQARRRHPEQLLIGLAWLSLIVSLSTYLAHSEFSILTFGLSALVLGFSYSVLGFFGHELMHGTMVRSRKLFKILSYPCFFIFCLSPELWDTWHNRLHHFSTNKPAADPDSSFTLERLHSLKFGKKILKYFPGSRHPLSVLFALSAFSVQTMNILWMRSHREPENAHYYEKMNRKRAVTETLVFYALWIAAAFYLGPLHFLFIMVIPAMVGNAFVVSYISIFHTTRPLSDDNRPLETTISVRSPKIMDILFFNFSHHIEHHVMPEANYRYYPMIQKALLTEFADEYCLLDHAQAIELTMNTPRVYVNNTTLVDVNSGLTVDLKGLQASGFRKTFVDEQLSRTSSAS